MVDRYRLNRTDSPVRPYFHGVSLFYIFSLFLSHIFLMMKQQFTCMTINWIAIVKCMKSIIFSTANYLLNFSLKVISVNFIRYKLYPFDAYFRSNPAKIEIPVLQPGFYAPEDFIRFFQKFKSGNRRYVQWTCPTVWELSSRRMPKITFWWRNLFDDHFNRNRVRQKILGHFVMEWESLLPWSSVLYPLMIGRYMVFHMGVSQPTWPAPGFWDQ